MYFHRQVDIKTGKLMIGRKMGELREGAVYSGGKKHDSYTIIYSANCVILLISMIEMRLIIIIDQSNS